ncbi:MAG: small subunit ribosomal protein [Acidimicrobiaceae bacterium]|nr:small subunit ribosomal protein [Acidimicrobiaceae bacterium]
MPRINNPKPPKRAPKIDVRRGVKKKPCSFCQHGVDRVDYKDLAQLRKYISDRGKIRGRKVSGNCQQHQRDVSDAIKTARELALLPYTQRTVTERRGGRGREGRDDRGPRTPRPSRDAAETTAPVIDNPAVEGDLIEDASEAAATFEGAAVAEVVGE